MTFIEALAEYHKGKRIWRKEWETCWYFDRKSPNITKIFDCQETVNWLDLLADDWITEDK